VVVSDNLCGGRDALEAPREKFLKRAALYYGIRVVK
jgi:hypothetical protein